jgi:hypothetical protein
MLVDSNHFEVIFLTDLDDILDRTEDSRVVDQHSDGPEGLLGLANDLDPVAE